MHDLPLPQKADGVDDVRIVHQTENIVVGGAGLLFRRHILAEVGDGVALGLEIIRGKGGPGSGHRIDAGGVVHKIIGKALGLDLLDGQIPGQLIDHGGDHLQMGQLLGAQRSIGNVPMYQIRGQA